MIDRAFMLYPMADIVGGFLSTFLEYPPRMKPASFTVDQVKARRSKRRSRQATDGWATLPSWNDGPAKTAVLEFVERVTTGGRRGSSRRPPASPCSTTTARSGASSRPTSRRSSSSTGSREQAAADPDAGREPRRRGAARRRPRAGGGRRAGRARRRAAPNPCGPDDGRVRPPPQRRWLEAARHPRFGVPYTALTLPADARADRRCSGANEFRVFVVTGGGVEFVRAVVGGALRRRARRTSSAPRSSCRSSDVRGASSSSGCRACSARPTRACRRRSRSSSTSGAGRSSRPGTRPATARCSSTRTHRTHCRRCGIVVDHDDDEREYAYESRSATDPQAEPILSSAARCGWTVVSMKRDWATVFGAGLDP